jgi:hypothetical protein
MVYHDREEEAVAWIADIEVRRGKRNSFIFGVFVGIVITWFSLATLGMYLFD